MNIGIPSPTAQRPASGTGSRESSNSPRRRSGLNKSAGMNYSSPKTGSRLMSEDEVSSLVHNALRRARQATNSVSPRRRSNTTPGLGSQAQQMSPTLASAVPGLTPRAVAVGAPPAEVMEDAIAHSDSNLDDLLAPSGSSLEDMNDSQEMGGMSDKLDIDDGDALQSVHSGSDASSSDEIIRRVEQEIANARKAAHDASQRLIDVTRSFDKRHGKGPSESIDDQSFEETGNDVDFEGDSNDLQNILGISDEDESTKSHGTFENALKDEFDLENALGEIGDEFAFLDESPTDELDSPKKAMMRGGKPFAENRMGPIPEQQSGELVAEANTNPPVSEDTVVVKNEGQKIDSPIHDPLVRRLQEAPEISSALDTDAAISNKERPSSTAEEKKEEPDGVPGDEESFMSAISQGDASVPPTEGTVSEKSSPWWNPFGRAKAVSAGTEEKGTSDQDDVTEIPTSSTEETTGGERMGPRKEENASSRAEPQTDDLSTSGELLSESPMDRPREEFKTSIASIEGLADERLTTKYSVKPEPVVPMIEASEKPRASGEDLKVEAGEHENESLHDEIVSVENSVSVDIPTAVKHDSLPEQSAQTDSGNMQDFVDHDRGLDRYERPSKEKDASIFLPMIEENKSLRSESPVQTGPRMSEKASSETNQDSNDLTSGTRERSVSVKFRQRFPVPPLLEKPRSVESIIGDNKLGTPDVVLHLAKPKRDLRELLDSIHGSSLARRANACGALKVLTMQNKNRLTLVRTAGVLDALVHAATMPISTTDVDVALDARARAIACVQNISEPRDNRPIVTCHEGLADCLVKCIMDDQGEARMAACGTIAVLAKTPACRESLVETANLIEVLATVLRDERPIFANQNVDKNKVTQQAPAHGDEEHSEDEDEEASHGSSASESSSESSISTKSDGEISAHIPPMQRVDSIRESRIANTVGTARKARMNACAALHHLSKHCAVSPTLCRNDTFIRCLLKVCTDFDDPIHSKCFEILCNLTRFPHNCSRLAQYPRVLDVLVAGGRVKVEDDRKWSLRSLQNLATDPQGKAVLASVKVLNLLSISCMRKEADEQRAAVACLYNLSTEPGAVVPLTNTKNVVATLVHVAHHPDSEPTIRLMACDTLATIGLWLQTLAGGGTVPESVRPVPLPSYNSVGWKRWD